MEASLNGARFDFNMAWVIPPKHSAWMKKWRISGEEQVVGWGGVGLRGSAGDTCLPMFPPPFSSFDPYFNGIHAGNGAHTHWVSWIIPQ